MRLNLRGLGVLIDPRLSQYVERRFRFALGRFGGRIGLVSVLLEDINGPRGGCDKRCRVIVDLEPTGQLVLELTARNEKIAAAQAADRIKSSVSRELRRRFDRRRQRSENHQLSLVYA